MNSVLGWHFVGSALRDGRPIPEDGKILHQEGQIIPCTNGLHASLRLIDALQYAPGSTICRVECSGTIVSQNDKFVASHRKILWRVDGTDLLWDFARECALSVAHLWPSPIPPVIKEYLETGDESLLPDGVNAWDTILPQIDHFQYLTDPRSLRYWPPMAAAGEIIRYKVNLPSSKNRLQFMHKNIWISACVVADQAVDALSVNINDDNLVITYANHLHIAARTAQNIMLENMVMADHRAKNDTSQ